MKSTKELRSIAISNGLKKEYLQPFIDRFYAEREEYIKEGDTELKFIDEEALSITLNYFKSYSNALSKGHSELWSKTFAESYYILEELADSHDKAYKAVREKYKCDYTNKKNNQVYSEAFIEGMNLFNSTFYSDLYANLIMIGEISSKALEYVEKYKLIYEKLIKQRKTELYANKYAEQFAEESNETYAQFYAQYYELQIKQNKSEEYADVFAEHIANDLTDIYERGRYLDSKEDWHYYEMKSMSYADGMEYAKAEGLTHIKEFAEIYNNKFLNKYFIEPFKQYTTEELIQFKNDVLQESLSLYNKKNN